MKKRAAQPRPVPGLEGARGRARRVVTVGDPDRAVLRSRSRRVGAVDASIRRLVADMLVTMRRAHGVGLAAVQIGVPLRVLVADTGAGPLALVNPQVRRRWGSQIGPEGCLSIPGTFGQVRRAERVEVTARNVRGRFVVVRGAGLLARVLQHELDHLNGVLFIDRIRMDRDRRRRQRRGGRSQVARSRAPSAPAAFTGTPPHAPGRRAARRAVASR